jgi:hypothetical protein
MKSLKNCIKLSSQVKVYVPSTRNIGESFESSEWIDKTMTLLSKEFGGATASKALGAWISAKGDLIKENVTVVFSYAKQEDLEKSIEIIYEFCLSMKLYLDQEAVALEVNGNIYLI